ncbi:hypothetical protein HMPREF9374_1759 [Desmospora sp. 8437]|nr:hypothetical protein HMPREF9374_1759 [Desmospora sp. 8437]
MNYMQTPADVLMSAGVCLYEAGYRSVVKKPFIPIGHKSRQGHSVPGLAMQGELGFTWNDFGSEEQQNGM